MLADALLRSVAGTTALLRVTTATADTNMSEVGLLPTNFAEVTISPVLMRKLRPTWQEGGQSKWELLVSANGVEGQVRALDLASAEALFAMTLAVTKPLEPCTYTGCYCEKRGSKQYEDSEQGSGAAPKQLDPQN